MSRLLRAIVRDVLALLGRRIDRHVCNFPNSTGTDDER